MDEDSGRATHHLLGKLPLDLLLYADDLESLATTARGRIGIVLSYLYLSAMGYPFKWAKTRGGFEVEWLGMETEYSSYKLGLTHKRASWLVSWLREKVREGQVTAREMSQGLGPLYAWSAAIQGKAGLMKIPAMIKVIFCWLADRLETGDRLQRPCRPPSGDEEIVFFTDAKAENGRD